MNILKPHVSLDVTDIDAAVAFYERAFGVAPTKRRPGYAKFDLTAPLLNLTMQQAARTGVNASHFGIQVAHSDDVREAERLFAARGLRTFREQDVTCCHAVQDKVWIEDPDGNAWEVFVVKGDAPVLQAAPAAATACCAPDCCAPASRDAKS
ncbi:MAG TPA: ArsI/CadI family heavy metal resistance metalloenzyme [Planctomycetota bacterium]|nr:ArsI/CadI family heavy metal resistance metalloenzyme [Planctomycetota bacterium]